MAMTRYLHVFLTYYDRIMHEELYVSRLGNIQIEDT